MREQLSRVKLGFYALLLIAGLVLCLPGWSQNAQSERPQAHKVLLLHLDDEIISPITAEYIAKGIEEASDQSAEAVIIQLDTPGGLLSSTHTIIKNIMNSPVPVAVYVGPAGARAGSAGVFITMAAHVAAMHPSSHIGAAHPVDAGGRWPGSSSPETPEPGEEGERKPSPDEAMDVMSQKIMNDTVSAIRVIARARDRNEEWAVRAVTESSSITAEEALEEDVIDITAGSIDSLLEKMDGMQVNVDDRLVTLSLENPVIAEYKFSTQQQVLSLLTHPMLAYFLLMIGFYGLLFEITHPGIGISGVIGLIALVLGLIGMQLMSINFAGLGLILLGLVMFVAELFTSTFGLMFAGGVISLVLGTMMLYQTDEPFLRPVIPFVISIALGIGLLTYFILQKAIKAFRKPSYNPKDRLINQIGRVAQPVGPDKLGKVKVYGEIWDAMADEELADNTAIRVLGFDPLLPRTLRVAAVEEAPPLDHVP